MNIEEGYDPMKRWMYLIMTIVLFLGHGWTQEADIFELADGRQEKESFREDVYEEEPEELTSIQNCLAECAAISLSCWPFEEEEKERTCSGITCGLVTYMVGGVSCMFSALGCFCHNPFIAANVLCPLCLIPTASGVSAGGVKYLKSVGKDQFVEAVKEKKKKYVTIWEKADVVWYDYADKQTACLKSCTAPCCGASHASDSLESAHLLSKEGGNQ